MIASNTFWGISTVKKFLAIALAATAFAGLPAAAQTYDAFSTFSGTQGAGNFYYGDLVDPNTFSFYSATTDCFIDGATCL